MEQSQLLSAAYFAAFSNFLFYQHLYVKNGRGASQGLMTACTFIGFIGMVVQFSYFIYYGWKVSWIDAFVIVLVAIFISSILGALLEKIIGAIAILMLGFITIPILGYMMFATIPISIVAK